MSQNNRKDNKEREDEILKRNIQIPKEEFITKEENPEEKFLLEEPEDDLAFKTLKEQIVNDFGKLKKIEETIDEYFKDKGIDKEAPIRILMNELFFCFKKLNLCYHEFLKYGTEHPMYQDLKARFQAFYEQVYNRLLKNPLDLFCKEYAFLAYSLYQKQELLITDGKINE